MRMMYFILIIYTLSLLNTACKKTENQLEVKKSALPGIQKREERSSDIQKMPSPHGEKDRSKAFQVKIPDEVKEQWEAVVLILKDNEKAIKKELIFKIGEEQKVPDTNLRILIGVFLPDFRLNDENRLVTSASNTPNNPALGVRIYEGDNLLFPSLEKKWGWLYAKYPQMHAFQHEKYQLILKEGIPKK